MPPAGYTAAVLEGFTRRVLRYRNAVIVGWLLIAALGVGAGLGLNERLTALTATPGSPSAAADALLVDRFGENSDGLFTVFVHFTQATDEEILQLRSRVTAAAAVLPDSNVLEQRALGGVLFTTIGTSMDLLQASAFTDDLRAALRAEGVPNAMVTGPPALEHDVRPVLARDLQSGTLLALGVALALLLGALGLSVAVLLPFLVAGASIAAALVLVYALTLRYQMVLYIPNIVELIGLGLAIDYALLIVHRFRRELAGSEDETEALARTMATAGRTVIFSGLTAAIGLSTLFLVPVPLVRSLGVAGLVMPLVSLAAALTLLPALLSLLGRSGVTPRGLHGWLRPQRSAEQPLGVATRLVIERPARVLAAVSIVLALLATPVLWMELAPASISAVPGNLESARALTFASDKAGPGVITPNALLIDLQRPGAATAADMQRARGALAAELSRDPEAFIVVSDTTPVFNDRAAQVQRLFVIGRHGLGEPQTQALIERLRALDLSKFGYPQSAVLHVGGAPAQAVDFMQRVNAAVPIIVVLVVLLAFVVMVRAFRSVLLAFKAVVLNLVSVAAACGILVLVFQFGWGADAIGAVQSPRIEAWSLLFLYAMLFGLSMDYQVFIVAAMREARDAGADTVQAIVSGLRSSSGVVTAAACIFIGALSGLVFGHIAGLQQLGLGLAFGVLIDATLVRMLLVPSAMMLFGEWNWWLPGPMARLLRITEAAADERPARH